MTPSADLLVEIGTEELPPKALRALMDAFAASLCKAIDNARLAHGDAIAYASPRRLAVIVTDLAHEQPELSEQKRGPPIKIAIDKDGHPAPPGIAFAAKCGVEFAALGREKTSKGEWLSFKNMAPGKTAAELLPGLIETALGSLPIPRRMRWGEGDVEFVRPLHWVVLLHGEKAIEATVMGITCGAESVGHRFHSSGRIPIKSPDRYLETLEKKGYVIADFERRREMIRSGVTALAKNVAGTVVDGDALYDEVAALVEWPVPLLGSFDEAFLELPRETVISTLTGHQRYFPLADADGNLLAKFITVANIDSVDPNQVRAGNERVIRPRLADAAFFWDNDRKVTLASRADLLREVIYQRGLGSLHDRSARIAALAEQLATMVAHDSDAVVRAAQLAKCDLLSGMVGEFPELQGTMGRYFAQADGEPRAVADAIGAHYLPRFAGDELPGSIDGQILAVADKLDTLAGVFVLGKKPSGNRDPFGLRRAALGIVRILIECGLDVDLNALLSTAVELQPKSAAAAEELASELYGFIGDRLRSYCLERDKGLSAATFEAVMVREPSSLLDFDRRLAAVQTFLRLEQAGSLAAANKRIANILRKAGQLQSSRVDKTLLQEDAERLLFSSLSSVEEKLAPLLATKRYAEVLNELADLRDPIDRFFDEVMVMADDVSIRNNRLALLAELRALFLHVADISRLSIG
jgi:glycyl-tRNA synthetase beta chain